MNTTTLLFLTVLALYPATTALSQAIPAPSHPPDGSTNQPTTVTLRWVPVLLATSYDVQVSTSSDFDNLIHDLTGIPGTSVEVHNLSYVTTYYWRVRAVVLLVPGLWSSTARFRTQLPPIQIPEAPTLVSPPNGASDQPTSMRFAWNHVSGADSYRIQISADRWFSAPTIDQTVWESAADISGLSTEMTYYWRVSAKNSAGTGPWSVVWSFSTRMEIPSAPLLASPPDGADSQPTTVALTWQPASRATSYTLQVAATRDFGRLLVNEPGILTTSKTLERLAYATTYYWRVSAQNPAGSGAWSEIWNFTTRHGPSGPPSLLSPPNGASGQPTALRLSWQSVAGADAYHVQVSANQNFLPPITDDSAVGGLVYDLDELASGTSYYWRVRAKNASGWGNWSETWSFLTEAFDSTRFYRLRATIDFPEYPSLADYSSTDYRIIGIPGASNAPLPEFLPGAAGEDWQAYWDNGQDSNYWIVYDAGPTFVFSVGRAFWILNRGPWTIDAIVPTPDKNGSGEVEIPLHRGWNLITCPFVTSVSWPGVQQMNGTNEPLYRYVNGRYGFSGSLEPFEGYYFFNATEASALRIPPEDNSGHPGESPTISGIPGSGWRVAVVVSDDRVVDDLLWFGEESDALQEKDARDVHKPHPISGFGSYFNRPEWDNEFPHFAADIRPFAEAPQRWRFTIESRRNSNVTISFKGIETMPAARNLVLVDEQSGHAVHVRPDETYEFRSGGIASTFTLITGTPEDIVSGVEPYDGPSSFNLGASYPNPFNPETVIPFEVPVESRVRMAVYDVLGRRIKVLVDEVVPKGRHRISWNGVNEEGKPVSSGVYFLRMEAEHGPILGKRIILSR